MSGARGGEDLARRELADLCHRLADPARQLAILGEGNAAAVVGDRQLVTASGSRLASTGPADLVLIDPGRLVAALDEDVDDAGWAALLTDAVDGPGVPTIEAALHAVAAAVTGCRWSAHTHPVSVTGLLSSDAGPVFATSPLFPDQIVVAGPTACLIPYTDPGLPLARAVRDALHAFRERQGRWPRVVLLGNHGMVALGRSPEEVEEITLMVDKAARIFAVAAGAGRVVLLGEEAVRRIDTRPDEGYRRRILHGGDS